MTYPVRYMAVETPYYVDEFCGYNGRVIDTLDYSAPLCECIKLEDAVNVARAMNVAEGYRVE